MTSTITRRSYDEAPVSPLFLFGRQQDFAYQQEVEGNPARRHHVRFWRTPDGWLLPGGRRVDWLAAGTFDRAVGLLAVHAAGHAQDRRRHRRRARPHRRDGARREPGARVEVLARLLHGYHSRNGGGDTIRTDGDLPVVDVRSAGRRSSRRREVSMSVEKRPAFESPGALARPSRGPRRCTGRRDRRSARRSWCCG